MVLPSSRSLLPFFWVVYPTIFKVLRILLGKVSELSNYLRLLLILRALGVNGSIVVINLIYKMFIIFALFVNFKNCPFFFPSFFHFSHEIGFSSFLLPLKNLLFRFKPFRKDINMEFSPCLSPCRKYLLFSAHLYWQFFLICLHGLFFILCKNWIYWRIPEINALWIGRMKLESFKLCEFWNIFNGLRHCYYELEV